MVSEKKILFFYHESMGANDPHGVANFEPWELYVVMATSSNPISPKTLSSLFPNLMMFYTKFDQNWPTDFRDTVNPVLSGLSKIDKTKVLKTKGSLMKVKSIAECSPWSILQCFDLH